MTNTIDMRLICHNPPQAILGDTEFGLQDKNQVLNYGIAQPDGSIHYDFTLKVQQKDDVPNFTGDYAHGTSSDRFLYLSLRALKDSSWTWVKRLKIPLKSITWAQVEQIINSGGVLEAAVSGEGSATVPLLGDGWVVNLS